jgi:hypothetical protein
VADRQWTIGVGGAHFLGRNESVAWHLVHHCEYAVVERWSAGFGAGVVCDRTNLFDHGLPGGGIRILRQDRRGCRGGEQQHKGLPPEIAHGQHHIGSAARHGCRLNQ